MFLSVTPLMAEASNWPIRRKIDLSSGFGDLRDNRFHAGVDLRTGGKDGVDVFSPVSGYVYRVNVSYFGYGKGLYVRGDDGHIYVFGHLSEFAEKIDSPVKAAQLKSKRYFQDIYFPEDSIPVDMGEFIGKTGQTGAGAPHLHFEKRSDDSHPINPLTHGYTIDDKTRPVFTRIGFKMTDDHSLFDTGRRELFREVTASGDAGSFTLDTALYFNAPFGVLVDCFDRMRPAGMRQTVYRLSLYIDGDLFYEVVLDTLDYETSAAVNLEYDYLKAVNDENWVRRLFTKKGDDYAGSRPVNSIDGTFGLEGDEKIGLHQGKVIAEDCSGNKSELSFEFLWGPPGYIYCLDSTSSAPPKSTFFHFTPVEGYEALGIDSVAVSLNRGTRWGSPPDSKVTELENGQIKCEVIGRQVQTAVLRLIAFNDKGCLIRDNLFNGISRHGKGNAVLSHEIVEDGLLLSIEVPARKGSRARIEFYYRDSLLGVEYPRYINMREHVLYLPPSKKYARIDRIGYSMSADPKYAARYEDSLNINIVGLEDDHVIEIDDFCSVRFNRDNLHEPMFIEVKANRLANRARLRLNSDHYQIFPVAFACRKDFEILMELPRRSPYNKRSGICWLDEENNRWIWLKNTREENKLAAKSRGGGSFAAVYDYDPPKIERLSVSNGRTYYDLQPTISFLLTDTLSGIEDDLDITIKLNGRWMIPEYDPETRLCKTRPVDPLSPGKHHLGIIVTDAAGNMTEQYLNFFVRKGKKAGRR